MKKLVLILAALMTISLTGCMKSPMERGESLGVVETLNEEGVLTTMDARVYEKQLQAQVITDCRSFQDEQMRHSYAAIGELDSGMERLVAIVSNQWKEAVIAMNGEDMCKPGSNEYDAYIAYAQAQGKIYEVVVGEVGKTFRFGVGSIVAGTVVDNLISGMGDRIAGDKLTGGHNAIKGQDEAEISVSSSETDTFTETHSTTSSSQVGTSDSTIDNPTATNNIEGSAAAVEGGEAAGEMSEEFCNGMGLTLRESTNECITWEYKSILEARALEARDAEAEE